MPVVRLVMAAAVSALSLLLVGCSNLPQRDDVIAQATQDNEIAFNVVKIDDAVVGVLAARPRPPFRERFKEYLPPPELKIAVGDTVSVVIWEAASNGLFGNSLAEFPSRPGGATGRTRTEATQGGATRSGPLGPSDQRLERSPFMEPGAARPSAPSPMAMPIEPNANTAFAPPERNAIQELAARASQTAPGTSIPSQPVGPDGTITIPYAGRVVAAGRTATELGRRIEALLGPIAIDPQALVVVQRGAGSSVSVAGDAIQGGRVPLSSGGSRLLDVIAAAGGVATPAAETFVRLSRDGVTASVPLAVLIAHPDQNIPARPGDVLIVSRVPQTLTVFGAAGKNDLITFDAERLSLAEALAKGGGLLDELADPSAVFVMRYEAAELVHALGQPVAARAPSGLSPVVYRLDLSDAKSYLLAKRFPVQDRDIIFIAEAKAVPITRALQAVSQITGPVTRAFIICRASGC